MYVDHVIKKYQDPVIVFDSYPELPSIKDVTHLRRTKGIVSGSPLQSNIEEETLDNSYLNTSAVFSKTISCCCQALKHQLRIYISSFYSIDTKEDNFKLFNFQQMMAFPCLWNAVFIMLYL
jgi:hypothetical protein